jgi:hypothetical protein
MKNTKLILLISLIVIGFAMILYAAIPLYKKHIPPFKEHACILFDVRYLFTTNPPKGTWPNVIVAVVLENNIESGVSTLALADEIAPQCSCASSCGSSFFYYTKEQCIGDSL